jgi:hypothetical protein
MPIYCEEGYGHSRLIAFRHEVLTELYDRLSRHGFRFARASIIPQIQFYMRKNRVTHAA